MRISFVLTGVLVFLMAFALAGVAQAAMPCGDAFFAAADKGSPAPDLMRDKCFSMALPDGKTLELWTGPSLPAANPAWKAGQYLHVYLVERAERYEKLVRPEDGQCPPVGKAYDGSGYYRVLADYEMPAGQARLLEALMREAF